MGSISRSFVGIDLHLTVAQICVLDHLGEVEEESRWPLRSGSDRDRFFACLQKCGREANFAVEALGLNRWLVNGLQERGLAVSVVDPTRLGLKMLGKKTDRRDAHEIARRLLLGDIDWNARSYHPDDEEYAVRKVLRTRHKLVSLRQQLVNQLRALLRAYAISEPGRPMYGSRAIAKLRRVEFPLPEMTSCLRALTDSLESVQASIGQLDEQVKHLAQRPDVRALAECLPSVGPQTALTLVYELGDPSRFDSARSAASYAGLVPRVYQSADKSHHGGLTKRGNSELRWILGQWAVRLLARNEDVQAWAKPRLKRQHRNKVRTALARRLLVGVYILLTTGEMFSLQRCLGH